MARKLIPEVLLLACERFGPGLTGEQVAASLAGGLRAGGRAHVDTAPLSADAEALTERMLSSRAVIIAAARLEERTLAGSPAFELATRARQSGVPAYAVTARDRLSAFDARMLDLQVVLEARDAPALAAAGRRLARLV